MVTAWHHDAAGCDPKAREQSLDLVEIPPPRFACLAASDYGKFLYEQEKKERAAKKNQKTVV